MSAPVVSYCVYEKPKKFCNRCMATFCWTRIAHKVGLHESGLYSRTSFIYKYKAPTLTPYVKPRNILNLAVQNIFYVQLYVESAFTYNPGSTGCTVLIETCSSFFSTFVLVCKHSTNVLIH